MLRQNDTGGRLSIGSRARQCQIILSQKIIDFPMLDMNPIWQEITHSHSLHIKDYLKDTLDTDPTRDYFLDTPSI